MAFRIHTHTQPYTNLYLYTLSLHHFLTEGMQSL